MKVYCVFYDDDTLYPDLVKIFRSREFAESWLETTIPEDCLSYYKVEEWVISD